MELSDFYSNFYVIDNPCSKKNYSGLITNNDSDFAQILRSEIFYDKLDIDYLEGGSEPSNVFWNQICEPFCVSDTIVSLLNNNNIRGWDKIPARVRNKSGDLLKDNYFALTVNGRIKMIDYLKSDIIIKQMPGGLFPYFKGLYFDPEFWDISDIFMEQYNYVGKATAFVFVTKKIVDIFKKNKITNIRFINFNDYEIPCSNITITAEGLYLQKINEKIKNACT